MNKTKQIAIPFIATAGALAILAASAWAGATSVTTTTRTPVTLSQTVPCLGDINVRFVSNAVTHMTTDASGGVHIDVHVNISEFDGVILASGVHFNGTQAWHDSINTRGPAPYEETYTETLTGIVPGSGLSLIFKGRFHMTIDANGRTTVDLESFDVECP